VLGAPDVLNGFVVALLILAPEAMSAVKAALNNQLQRAVNILLGSVLATIGLTVPAVLMIGLVTESTIMLGLSPVNTILLALLLSVSTITFSNSRTNAMLGAVHILMFAAYLMLMFDA
jgi:Ca2+:H+ antiporter